MTPLENLKETLIKQLEFSDNEKLTAPSQLVVDEAFIAKHVDEKIKQLQFSEIMQSAFISSVAKHVDEIVKHPKITLVNYTLEDIKSLISSITTNAFDERREDCLLQFQNFRFLMIQNRKIYLIGQKLGKGGFGSVYLLSPLRNIANEDEVVVMKLAKFNEKDPVKNRDALFNIENEYQLLSKIHAHGDVEGIQAKPIKMLNITAQASGVRNYGYLGKKYDEDYSVGFGRQIPFRERIQEFIQLLKGLTHIHYNKIVHSDIKPNNILIKYTLDNKLVHIFSSLSFKSQFISLSLLFVSI